MQLTQLSAVSIALGVVLALAMLVMLVWRGRVRRLNGDDPEARCRRDIEALKRRHQTRASGVRSDIWEAGAPADPSHSRSKKAATWVALGSVGGCGGCGGCGCGG
jgi:uncharacterized membrane protein YccC